MKAERWQPPPEPICQEPDGTTPCRFAGVCHTQRQLIQAGYSRSLGQWVTDREPLRGQMCWAYQQQLAKPAREISAALTPLAPRPTA